MFAPWRLEYVSNAAERRGPGCVFCAAYRSQDDRESHTLWRRERSFALLNRYPYTSGHSMVAPIEHERDLDVLDDETVLEMMRAARDLMRILRQVYRPHGFNVGFNVGEAAGAGIEQHLHLHVVPRWRADTNLMGVVAGTRVIPEDLGRTWDRIRQICEGEGPTA